VTDSFDPDRFDPHDPGFLADPYPTYACFREQAPIHRVAPYGSSWVFTHADCTQLLTATDVWVKEPPAGAGTSYGPHAIMAEFPPGLFSSDPPLHTQLRSILEPLFDEAISDAPALAAQIAAPLLAAAGEHGRMELVSDYALALPSRVLFTLLGIPDDPGLWDGLVAWQAAIAAAHDITQSAAIRVAGATCSMALNTYFEGMLLAHRGAPSSGLFAQICDAFLAAGLSPQQVQMCAIDFLVAGYLSTTFVIGTGIRNLLLYPDQLTALREQPARIPGALEEMLRFDAPAQLADRFAAVDTELGGQTFRAGDMATAVLGSADRDPAVFTDPDRFAIDRGAPHLSFGAGIHACIGAPLVRLVGPVAVAQLLAAFPELELDGLAQWQTDPYLRAVTNLPLRLGGAGPE
jgi:cytochrome P450